MAGEPVSGLKDMLAGMNPHCDPRPHQFLDLPTEDANADWIDDPFAVIREDEGVTYIVATDKAVGNEQDFARITLQVHSALQGVGLTAAVANALAEADVACNVIAGFHHDHLFVPWYRREDAMVILKRLSDDARR